jgi:hypothetical protein
MTNRLLLISAMAALTMSVGSARADETGLAAIHTWKKVGKKTCMLDHYHSGQGTGANRKAAEAAAIQSWASFTDLEYGSSWASFKIAERKSVKCSQDGSNSFSCQIEALACRPY